MDAEVVDIRETEREFQADMPRLEPLDMNMVTRAKMILFRTAPRWSAPALLFLLCASPSYLSGGPRRTEGIGVEEITESAKKFSRAKKKELVSVLVHVQKGVPHTLQRTLLKRHHDRQT